MDVDIKLSLKPLSAIYFLVLITLTIAGCGGGGGSPEPETTSTISVFLTKAPISDAICNLHGIADQVIAGPVSSNAGRIQFTGISYNGDVYTQCSGGSYVDEATGSTVQLAAQHIMRSVTNAIGGSSTTVSQIVTPLTEIAHRLARAGGELSSADMATSAAEIADNFGLDGIDITQVQPTSLDNINGNTRDSDRYGIALAAVSQMLEDGRALQAAPTGDELISLITQIESDLNNTGFDSSTYVLSLANLTSNPNTQGVIADTSTVSSLAGTNLVPIANGGEDQTVVSGAVVTLNGSGTDTDGSINSYSWEEVLGSSLNLGASNNAALSFTAPTVSSETNYTLRLTVVDSAGASASDEVTVTVRAVSNTPPTADAGSDHSVNEGTSFVLSGSGNDSEGNVTYRWLQVSGPLVQISDSFSSNTTVKVPEITSESETVILELEVSDLGGLTATDQVAISINGNGNNESTVTSRVLASEQGSAIGFTSDAMLKTLNAPSIGRNGHVAFSGLVVTDTESGSTTSSALWSGMPASLLLTMQQGDMVSGFPNNVLIGSEFLTTPIVTSSGYVAVYTELQGEVGPGTDEALVVHVNGETKKVFQIGDHAVGLEVDESIRGSNQVFAFSDAGLVFISGYQRQGNYRGQALWYWDFEELRLLAKTELESGLYTNCAYEALHLPRINDAGKVVFTASFEPVSGSGVTCPYGGLYAWNATDGLEKMVDTNSVVPNIPNATFYPITNLPGSIKLDDSGGVVFASMVNIDGYYQGVSNWYKPANSAIQLISAVGETLPNDFTSKWNTSSDVAGMTNSGLIVAISADTYREFIMVGAPRSTVPYSDFDNLGASQFTLMARTGTLIEDGQNSLDELRSPMITNGNDVIFQAKKPTSSVWLARQGGGLERLIEEGQDLVLLDDTVETLVGVQFGDATQLSGASGHYASSIGGGGALQHSDSKTIVSKAISLNGYFFTYHILHTSYK